MIIIKLSILSILCELGEMTLKIWLRVVKPRGNLTVLKPSCGKLRNEINNHFLEALNLKSSLDMQNDLFPWMYICVQCMKPMLLLIQYDFSLIYWWVHNTKFNEITRMWRSCSKCYIPRVYLTFHEDRNSWFDFVGRSEWRKVSYVEKQEC